MIYRFTACHDIIVAGDTWADDVVVIDGSYWSPCCNGMAALTKVRANDVSLVFSSSIDTIMACRTGLASDLSMIETAIIIDDFIVSTVVAGTGNQ